MSNNVEFYMTRKDVADIFGVTEATVGNWANRGMLQRARISATADRGMITSTSVKMLKDEFENVGQCELEIRKYRRELVAKNEEIASRLKVIRQQYELVKHTGTYISLIREMFMVLAKGQFSQRDIEVITECMNGKDFELVADKYNISSERVRQIMATASTAFASAPSYISLTKTNDELRNEIKNLKIQLSLANSNTMTKSTRAAAILGMNISSTNLSVRTQNCLESSGYKKVCDIALSNERELRNIRNFGQKCLDEVKAFLGRYDLSLGMRNTETDNM